MYLFVQVRSNPATASPSKPSPPADKVAQTEPAKETSNEARKPATPHLTHTTPAPTEGAHEDDGSAAPAAHPLHIAKGLSPTALPGHSSREGSTTNPKLDALMDEANKAYDHGDVDEARAIAGKVLAKVPDSTRMMRIMVSASCMDGDQKTAQKYYSGLPAFDKNQMKTRCKRDYNVSLED